MVWLSLVCVVRLEARPHPDQGRRPAACVSVCGLCASATHQTTCLSLPNCSTRATSALEAPCTPRKPGNALTSTISGPRAVISRSTPLMCHPATAGQQARVPTSSISIVAAHYLTTFETRLETCLECGRVAGPGDPPPPPQRGGACSPTGGGPPPPTPLHTPPLMRIMRISRGGEKENMCRGRRRAIL